MPFFDLRALFAARRAPETPFAAGVRALARNHAEEALARFTEALAAAADDAERARAQNKRGVAFVQLGRHADAAEAFFAAAALDPRFAAPLVNIGNLLYEDGVVDDAIVHYEAALRIDDDDATAHLNLAVAFRALGKRGAAVHHLRRSHRLDMRGPFRRGRR
jgi:tetratricopeptide (TPR) repeat protein